MTARSAVLSADNFLLIQQCPLQPLVLDRACTPLEAQMEVTNSMRCGLHQKEALFCCTANNMKLLTA